MADEISLPIRQVPIDPRRALDREWIVTNGIGGYSAGTLAGICTRRYHGILVAALPPPFGRMLMLSHLSEALATQNDRVTTITVGEWSENLPGPTETNSLKDFYLEGGLPVWRYEIDDTVIEKRVFMPHMQNTVQFSYRVIRSSRPVQLRIRPSFQFRHHEAPANRSFDQNYRITADGDRFEIQSPEAKIFLRLRLLGQAPQFALNGGSFHEVFYPYERARGYEALDRLWCPGTLIWDLRQGESATLVASTENWDTINALKPEEVAASEFERRRRLLASAKVAPDESILAELTLAADSFMITPHSRVADRARASALGDEVRSVIAGYYWFTDWGRDTMISFEGLSLCTGREREAGYILRTFAYYVRDGLIPNMFPDGGKEGLYHTADATLWYFHALDRYLKHTGDKEILRQLLPVLIDVLDHHFRGTRFGIGMDPKDGLLTQGQDGYQLTWMDAKVGDWVVTPRRGKAVEINALWYNALRLMSGWMDAEQMGDAAKVRAAADRVEISFNQKFWRDDLGYLLDVVDDQAGGDDASFRPNQIFSFSLAHPVLDPKNWAEVLQKVDQKLFTPFGLRSLAPGQPNYKARYDGDLRARDAAYHEGTVWGWLVGPFIDAYLRVHPTDLAGARKRLEGFIPHLSESGLGSISEVFDAEAPYLPRGCPAQAWSVAEVLRCWKKTS